MSEGRSDLIMAHCSHKGLLIVMTACTTLKKPPRFKELGRQKRSAFMSFSAMEIMRVEIKAYFARKSPFFAITEDFCFRTKQKAIARIPQHPKG
ncbi:hypothetical protein CEXT_335291 [Caerostris extrusa]|uniref:Uncharacterized protein n=1 Tax=Caerostris extrusa TaxID=172846 RepID=A0AAV4NNK1_CAEEX|nr:hypothetical protein CEXT_335291 [Caerostris extrusa]